MGTQAQEFFFTRLETIQNLETLEQSLSLGYSKRSPNCNTIIGSPGEINFDSKP